MINSENIPRDLIVIGASAGGVEALTELFSSLPIDLPASIAVVIHRSPLYSLHLRQVLGRRSTLPVREPHPHEIMAPGTIYLAPRDHHMVVNGKQLTLNRGPKEHFTRPAVDPLFASAAASYGPRVTGVLLTGAGEDGVAGLIAIKQHGGLGLVQDPKDAKIRSMPLNALRYDHVDLALPLSA
ncbi:MAG TPA: chemotaxis protein CheB, partial [Nitrospiraceae bacterium]|nr:chemotaxis protein CheB [Nitrospiraceae bacterium]